MDLLTDLRNTSILIEETIDSINELNLKIKNARTDTDVTALAAQIDLLKTKLERLDQKYLSLTGLFD